MKKIIAIIAIVSALLFSCVGQPEEAVVEPEPLPFAVSDTLKHIDSLMQSDADSALMALVSVISTGDKFNANYHSLLLSEALYKTGNPQLNRFRNETFRETSLQDAMRYFDSLAAQYPHNDDLTVFSARSHYMNGVGFYENDSIIEACEEYLHSLEIMENHFDVEKLTGYKAKFMGLTYTRLGELFFDYGLKKASVEMYQTAVKYFEKVDDYCLANPIRSLALSFALDNQADSAVFYYREAIYLAKKHNKPSVLGKCLSELAPIYYDLGYIDSAFIMARESLSLPSNDDNQLINYFTLGELFYKEYVFDSAIFYLEKSINSRNYATQVVSAEILVNCYLVKGDSLTTKYYKDIYADNFTKYRNIVEIQNELTKIYETYKLTKEQKTNQLLAKKQNRHTVILLFAIVAIMLAIIAIYKIKIHQTIIKSDKSLAEKTMALDAIKRNMTVNAFIHEPICKTILEVVNKQHFKSRVPCAIYMEYALTKEQLLALKDAMDRHYDNFTQWICKEYPKLTIDDIDYCCLYYIGLKDTDIAALMQRAYPTIGERSRKLKYIFGSNKPLHTTIKNIIASHNQ